MSALFWPTLTVVAPRFKLPAPAKPPSVALMPPTSKPLLTVRFTVLFCRAMAWPSCKTPALTVVEPLKPLAPVKVSLPPPSLTKLPVPYRLPAYSPSMAVPVAVAVSVW